MSPTGLQRYGYWGSVCDDGWDDIDVAVLCCQLGYKGTAIGAACVTTVGTTLMSQCCVANWVTKVRTMDGDWGSMCNDGCDDIDVGVLCRQLGYKGTAIGAAYVTTVGTTLMSQCCVANWVTKVRTMDGDWGSVCDDGCDDIDVGVLCRQLGYKGEDNRPAYKLNILGDIYPVNRRCHSTNQNIQEVIFTL